MDLSQQKKGKSLGFTVHQNNHLEVFLEVYKTAKTNYYFFSNNSIILISPTQKGPQWHVAITATSAPHVQLVSLGKTWKFAFRLAPSSSNGKPEEI